MKFWLLMILLYTLLVGTCGWILIEQRGLVKNIETQQQETQYVKQLCDMRY